jgi:NADH:ubiquinone oxidoreductase subunit E
MAGTVAGLETQVTEEQKRQIDYIIDTFDGTPGRLIPVLHEIQKVLGFLPPEIQEYVAHRLNIPVADVHGVVTFYSLFSEKPKGRFCIGVCKGTACYVKKSQKLLDKLEEILGIGGGDTTDDGKYSVEVLRCLGSCGLGPVMTINERVYTRVKPDSVKNILKEHEEWEANRDECS